MSRRKLKKNEKKMKNIHGKKCRIFDSRLDAHLIATSQPHVRYGLCQEFRTSQRRCVVASLSHERIIRTRRLAHIFLQNNKPRLSAPLLHRRGPPRTTPFLTQPQLLRTRRSHGAAHLGLRPGRVIAVRARPGTRGGKRRLVGAVTHPKPQRGRGRLDSKT